MTTVDDPLDDPLRPRQFTSAVVRRIYDDWKLRTEERLEVYRRFNALWRTDYWKDRGLESDRYTDLTTSQDHQIRMELNRINNFVKSFLGPLFPQKIMAKIEPDDDGRGNAKKAQRWSNRWLRRRHTESRLIDLMLQAIVNDGACGKITIDHERARIRDRVRFTILPWWEAIVDRDVTDIEGQRFIAHVYWIPRAVAVRRFQDPDLHGSAWVDPLGKQGLVPNQANAGTDNNAARQDHVCVVEWYNYADDYVFGEADPTTHRPLDTPTPLRDPTTGKILTLRGRYETYLPEEPNGWDAPREVRPLPFVDVDGEQIPQMHPLVFEHEIGYPLRGLSTVERVYDMFRGAILLMSMDMNAARRNARQILLPKGWLGPKVSQDIARGVDGLVGEYEQPSADNRNIAQVAWKVDFGNIPSDNSRVAADINAETKTRPSFTQGGVDPYVSATQTNLQNTYAANEIGLMATARDICMEGIVRHQLVATVAAMRSDGPDAKVSVWIKGERLDVTAEDLDADFEITIKSGPATNAEADALRQRLLAVLPTLFEVLGGVQEGNAAAVLMLDELVDVFELPDELRAKHLAELIQKSKGTPSVTPQPGQALPGGGQMPTAGNAAPEGPMPASVKDGTAQNGPGTPLNVRA